MGRTIMFGALWGLAIGVMPFFFAFLAGFYFSATIGLPMWLYIIWFMLSLAVGVIVGAIAGGGRR